MAILPFILCVIYILKINNVYINNDCITMAFAVFLREKNESNIGDWNANAKARTRSFAHLSYG